MMGRMNRIIRCALLVVFLVGVGAGVYDTPAGPRWSVRTNHPSVRERPILLDGGRVLTIQCGDTVTGPLVVRDVQTGRQVASWWAETDVFRMFRVSQNGRWGVGITQANRSVPARLRWVDFETGWSQETLLPPGPYFGLNLAPAEPLAFVTERDENKRDGEQPARVSVYDLTTAERVTTLHVSWSRYYLAFVSGRLRYYSPNDEEVAVWDLSLRKSVTNVPGWPSSSLDGALLILDDSEGFDYWNLAGTAQRMRIPRPGAYNHRAVFAKGFFIVSPCEEEKGRPVEFWDLSTGKKHWEFPTSRVGSSWPGQPVSPDGRFALVPGEDRPSPKSRTHQVVDLQNKRLVCTLTGPVQGFTPDSRWLVCSDNDGAWCVDPATGEEGPRFPVCEYGQRTHVRFANNGRQLWMSVCGEVDPSPPSGWFGRVRSLGRGKTPYPDVALLRAVELPSGRKLFELRDAGVWEYVVSDDGAFVLTGHREGKTGWLLRRWDVPPPRRWSHVIGLPLTLGTVIAGLWAWWARRRCLHAGPGTPDAHPGGR
jgi:hypothetical protein